MKFLCKWLIWWWVNQDTLMRNCSKSQSDLLKKNMKFINLAHELSKYTLDHLFSSQQSTLFRVDRIMPLNKQRCWIKPNLMHNWSLKHLLMKTILPSGTQTHLYQALMLTMLGLKSQILEHKSFKKRRKDLHKNE